jgi:hypothetical protein
LYAPSKLVVNFALPVNSVKELTDFAKRNPGKLTFASNGVGFFPHDGRDLQHGGWPRRAACALYRRQHAAAFQRPDIRQGQHFLSHDCAGRLQDAGAGAHG